MKKRLFPKLSPLSVATNLALGTSSLYLGMAKSLEDSGQRQDARAFKLLGLEFRQAYRTLRRGLTLGLICLCLSLPSLGCQHAPPNLSPQAVAAFHGTQVIHDLDRIRDAADAAHHTTPPLLDAATTLKIVTWHQSAITVVHAAPSGWKATVLSSLDQLNTNLTDKDRQVIAPYVALARGVLQEVGQ
jgi:hypothetical protein